MNYISFSLLSPSIIYLVFERFFFGVGNGDDAIENIDILIVYQSKEKNFTFLESVSFFYRQRV